jgi:hypothetical protein
MLDLTGGDAASLTEVRTALDQVAAHPDPDLIAALRLAHHRDYLTERNRNISAGLPAVWATLGHFPRAEAVARSITHRDKQADVLGRVAGVLAAAGSWSRPRPWPARSPIRTCGRAGAVIGFSSCAPGPDLRRDGVAGCLCS